MRSSTVIFSSRRNSLKRESETDLLRRAARDAHLGFLVAGIAVNLNPVIGSGQFGIGFVSENRAFRNRLAGKMTPRRSKCESTRRRLRRLKLGSAHASGS